MATDFYKDLGVSRDAKPEEIKSAYRKLAAKHHPDRNKDDKRSEAKFKRINRANQVLSDQKKRKLYDEFGEEGLREGFDEKAARAWGVGANGNRGRWPPSGGGGSINFEDILREGGGVGDLFGDLFGGSRRARSPRKGADVASEVTVDFVDAVRGATLELKFHDGGDVVKVRVPAGAADGDKVRVRGQGAPGRNDGPAGDLVIRVTVRPHPLFERDGLDLYLDLPITVGEAYKGAKVPVPTPSGDVTLTVPTGAQSGKVMRLKGKGVKRKGKAGDLFVRFLIQIPDSQSKQVQLAIDALEGSMKDADVRAGVKF